MECACVRRQRILVARVVTVTSQMMMPEGGKEERESGQAVATRERRKGFLMLVLGLSAQEFPAMLHASE